MSTGPGRILKNLAQIPDGFWMLNTRPVSKRNTKIRALHYNI